MKLNNNIIDSEILKDFVLRVFPQVQVQSIKLNDKTDYTIYYKFKKENIILNIKNIHDEWLIMASKVEHLNLKSHPISLNNIKELIELIKTSIEDINNEFLYNSNKK